MPPDSSAPTKSEAVVPAPFDPDERKMPLPCADRIPPFLCKLYQIVQTPDTDHCIRWSSTRDSLLIVDQQVFSGQILPLYFKHSSIRSFIRQLNTYGFRKRTRAEHIEFWNPAFKADRLDLLLQIKRVGAKQEPVAEEVPTDLESAHKVELMNVDVQVQELRRELRDMRSLMQQYLHQLDFKIAMQSQVLKGGGAAPGSLAQAPKMGGAAGLGAVGDNEVLLAYLATMQGVHPPQPASTAAAAASEAVVPPQVQAVMHQAQQMHQQAEQIHAQQLQQLLQLQQAQQAQQQFMLLQQQQAALGASAAEPPGPGAKALDPPEGAH